MSKQSKIRRAAMRADSQAANPASANTSNHSSQIAIPDKMPGKNVRVDDWENVYTGMGGAKDKRNGTTVSGYTIFNREQMSQLYRGSDVVATIVDLPADEMTREWIDFNANDDADNETQSAVLDFLDGADDGPNEEQGLQTKKAFHEALKWARLFGGAGIVMGINDGKRPSEPVDYTNIQSIDFLNVLDRFSLRPSKYYSDPMQKKYGQPELYRLQATNQTSGNVLSETYVHESRVLRFDGTVLPPRDMLRNNNDGWGDSILTRVWEVVRDYASVWMGFSYLLGDAAQTTIKVAGLKNAIVSPGGMAFIQARMEAIEMCRSIARAVMIDEGEEFKREVVNLSGIPDAMQKFIERLAQAARMPIELLMGQPPGGLNGNGDTGMHYWYAQVGAMQERMMRAPMMRLVRIVLASKNGPTQGVVPERWGIDFKPLEIPNEAVKADVFSKVSAAVVALVGQGILDPDEAANSLFGTGKFSMDIKLDKVMRARIAEVAPTPEEEAAHAATMKQAQTVGAVAAATQPKSSSESTKTNPFA